MKYDVAVVGAGVAGLVTASLLAKEGKRVALVEGHRYLGGRAMHHRYRGHEIGLGSHLVEDPGDSLTRACDYVGITVEHSERSDSMPFWDRTGWKPIQDFYGGAARQGLKRCIEAVTQSEYSEFDTWDHASLREWMSQYTSDEGVFLVWEAISVLEQITFRWWEHSASENLYTRKLHYDKKRTAGYSFWPMGGWETLWKRDGGGVRAQRGHRAPVRDGRARRDRERAGEGSRAAQPGGPLETRRGDRSRSGRGQRAGVGPATSCSTTTCSRGISSSGSSCSPTTATRRAGSGTGSRPRSR